MKRVFAIVVSAVLIALSSVSAFAAGINQYEQQVLDELATTVQLSNGVAAVPEEYINQARNYFNTIDLTASQAFEIIALIEEGKSIIADSGAATLSDLTDDQKSQVLDKVDKIMDIVNLTFTYDKASSTYTATDSENDVAFSASPSVSEDGTWTDKGVVKTTGASVDYTALAVTGCVVALVAVSSAVVVIKNKKERV
jgi:hypothetical protein